MAMGSFFVSSIANLYVADFGKKTFIFDPNNNPFFEYMISSIFECDRLLHYHWQD